MDESTKNCIEIIISAIAAIGTIGAVIYAIYVDKIKDYRNKILLDIEDYNIKGNHTIVKYENHQTGQISVVDGW